jgi:ABC-2 type transport system permease protein
MSARAPGVAVGITRRGIAKARKNLALAASPMAVPLFMFAAFAGAMTAIGDTKGFDYYNYTAFIFIFVLFMATIFVGMFTGMEMAADYGAGFGDRLMLAAPQRLAILGGYVLYSFVRGLVAIAAVWGVALIAGMPVRGNAFEIVGIIALAILIGVAETMYAAGLALRMRSMMAAALIFMPSFLVLFLTPDFVPLNLLTGWLHTVARFNPLTPAMEAGRSFMAGTSANVGLAFGLAVGLVLFFTAFAIRGMRKAEQGPGAPSGGPRGPAARRAARQRARHG